MTKNILYIFGFIFLLAFSACKGGGSPAPETLEAKLIRIQDFTLQTATVNETDSKATFLLQSFTTPSDKATSNLGFYPSGNAVGNWSVDSESAFTITYSENGTTYALKFTDVSIENDILRGNLEIPANAGGKGAAITATVEYRK